MQEFDTARYDWSMCEEIMARDESGHTRSGLYLIPEIIQILS